MLIKKRMGNYKYLKKVEHQDSIRFFLIIDGYWEGKNERPLWLIASQKEKEKEEKLHESIRRRRMLINVMIVMN